MYTLSASTTLTAVLTEAATVDPTLTVTYSDVLLSSGGAVASRLPVPSGVVATTGTVPVVVVASPAAGYAREIENIAFRNKDTVSHTVTFGGAIDVVWTVPAGQILTCDSRGSWRLGADNTVQMAGDVTGPSNASILNIVSVAKGGTGASTSNGARTSLGLAIGTDVQAWDADLDAISALAGTSGLLRKTAANTWLLDTAAYLTGNQTVTISGDASGSGTTAIALTLAASGVTIGTYQSVTVDAKGRVTGGTNPTTLAGYGITDALASSQLDTDGTLAANSDSKIASQKAVKTYVAAYLAAQDAMTFKGVIDCSASPNYPAADAGNTYRVSVAGKIGGASGAVVEVGDTLMCTVDGSTAGTQAAVGANWGILQTNIDGAVVGPSSATDGQLALFSGTSGKLIKAVTSTGDVSYSSAGVATVGKIGGYSVTLTGTVTLSGGHSFAATLTGNTAVTFPTSGTLATTNTAQTISGIKNYTATPVFTADLGLRVSNPGSTAWASVTNGTSDWRVAVGINAGNDGVFGLYDATHSAARLAIDTSGNVGIGTTSPSEKLTVSGNVVNTTANSGSIGTASVPWAGGYFQTAPTVTSGVAAKTNIRDFTTVEKNVAKAIVQSCPQLYQLVTSVTEKGAAKARLHGGMVYEQVYKCFTDAGFAEVDIEKYGLFVAAYPKKTVTKTRTVSKQKTVVRTRTVESIAVSEGAAVLTTTTQTYAAPVFETLSVKDADGNVIPDRIYQNPVMEDVTETYMEEVDDTASEKIKGLRYSAELEMWCVVGLQELNADLSARVAALEAKAAADG